MRTATFYKSLLLNETTFRKDEPAPNPCNIMLQYMYVIVLTK